MSNAIRRSRLNNWTKAERNLSDCNWTRTQNHLVRKQTLKIAVAISNVLASTIYFHKEQTDALI